MLCPVLREVAPACAGHSHATARKLRIEYLGTVCPVMNRGDQREPIFKDDADRQRYVEKQSEARAPISICRTARQFSTDFIGHLINGGHGLFESFTREHARCVNS
jgi:hypothetical protein